MIGEHGIEPVVEADTVKKAGESTQDHLKRMFELKSEAHDMAPDFLEAICKTFGIKSPDKVALKKCNWLEVKAFVFNCLNLADVPCDDFSPKQVANV